jgi:hypothetical protein
MRRFYVTRDKWGWKYKTNDLCGWSHTDNSVIDHASLVNYLTQNGRYDKPDIVFTDGKGKPANLYEVTRHNGSILAVANGRDKIPLVRQHFLSDDEAADWFKINECSDVVKNEADSKATAQDRLKYYQDNATELTKEMYERLCSQKMSDEGIKSFLKKQAEIEGPGAEVLFSE